MAKKKRASVAKKKAAAKKMVRLLKTKFRDKRTREMINRWGSTITDG